MHAFVLFSSFLPLFSTDKLNTGGYPMPYYLSINEIISERIQDGAKLFASAEGPKLHWEKNNHVYSINGSYRIGM